MSLLIADIDKIKDNLHFVIRLCKSRGVDLLGVIKGCNGYPPIVQAFLDAGVKRLGLISVEKDTFCNGTCGASPVRLCLPSAHLVERIATRFTASLNTEATLITGLHDAARKAGVTHDVIIMTEIGDLREGVMPADAVPLARHVLDLPGDHIRLGGLAAHFACMSGLLPNEQSLDTLLGVADAIHSTLGYRVPTVSVGGSDFLRWMENKPLPPGITEIRIGFSILLGRLPDHDAPHPKMRHDALILRGDVLEAKEKPSMPWGATGVNAFGEKPSIRDRGVRKRAVVGFGALDTDPTGLTCTIPGVELIGFNSNYSVFDIGDASEEIRPGDTLDFLMNYKAMTLAFHSPLVDKTTR